MPSSIEKAAGSNEWGGVMRNLVEIFSITHSKNFSPSHMIIKTHRHTTGIQNGKNMNRCKQQRRMNKTNM
jgi:hypothetical protein